MDQAGAAAPYRLSATKWPERTLSLDEHIDTSNWHGIAQALREGKNVVQCAGEFEKSSIISWVNNIFDADIADYRGLSSDKQWWACYLLGKLAIAACSANSVFDNIEIFKDGEKEYVLKRENGKVFFNEITTKKPFFSFGNEQAEVSVIPLFEVDISELMEAAKALFKGEIVDEKSLPLLPLLTNNPILLEFIAEQVICAARVQQGQLDPDLAKHALRYDWEQKYAAAIPTPPIFPTDIYGVNFSPSLRSFLNNGQLPPSELERSSLLGEAIHELMWDTPSCTFYGNRDNFECSCCNLFHAIIEDITHLNFKLIDIESINKIFRKVCWFLAHYYEGNSVSFRGLPSNATYSYQLQWTGPLSYLLQRNPNLTSIGLQEFSMSPEITSQVLDLINNCTAITGLAINNCNLTDRHVDHVAKKLAPHVVNLSLRDNQLTLPSILALLQSTTLTSLDLGECHFTAQEQQKILQALRRNQMLTVFQIGAWESSDLQAECEFQLHYNKSQFYKVRLLSHASVALNTPRELLYQIGGNLNAMSR